MNEIFYRASVKNGVHYSEFMSEIKKAQMLCGDDSIDVGEFVKKLTVMAIERYLEDNL